jgi:hypothetical protein
MAIVEGRALRTEVGKQFASLAQVASDALQARQAGAFRQIRQRQMSTKEAAPVISPQGLLVVRGPVKWYFGVEVTKSLRSRRP